MGFWARYPPRGSINLSPFYLQVLSFYRLPKPPFFGFLTTLTDANNGSIPPSPDLSIHFPNFGACFFPSTTITSLGIFLFLYQCPQLSLQKRLSVLNFLLGRHFLMATPPHGHEASRRTSFCVWRSIPFLGPNKSEFPLCGHPSVLENPGFRGGFLFRVSRTTTKVLEN